MRPPLSGSWNEDAANVVPAGGKEIFADDDSEFFQRLEKVRLVLLSLVCLEPFMSATSKLTMRKRTLSLTIALSHPQAGVAPTKVFKKFGAHDWILHDWVRLSSSSHTLYDVEPELTPLLRAQSVPTSWRTKATGPESKFTFGLDAIVSLLSRVAADAATSSSPRTARRSADKKQPSKIEKKPSSGGASAIEKVGKDEAAAHESYAQVAGHEEDAQAPVVAKGEGDVLHVGGSIEGSGVLVEKPAKGSV